jgi:hypothetical protein
MARPTLQDVETVAPSNWGPGGGYRIECPGGCEEARRRGYVSVWGHRYLYGYTKKEALTQWRADHPRENGGNK